MTKIRKKSAVKPDVRTPSGTDQQIDESRSGKHINHENPQGSPAVMAAPASTSLNAKTAHSIPDGRMILKSALPRTAAAKAPSIREAADRYSPYTLNICLTRSQLHAVKLQ